MCSKAKTCTVQGLYENSYVWIMVERVFFILWDSKTLLAKTLFFPPFFSCWKMITNHRTVWTGRGFKAHPVPAPIPRAGTRPTNQAAQSRVQLCQGRFAMPRPAGGGAAGHGAESPGGEGKQPRVSTGSLGLLCPGQKCADTPSNKPGSRGRGPVTSAGSARPLPPPPSRGLSGAKRGRGGACAGGAGRDGAGQWRSGGAGPAVACGGAAGLRRSFASLPFPGRFPACPCPRGRASAGRALLPPRRRDLPGAPPRRELRAGGDSCWA